ncbi:MAG: hypothetical protein LH478_00450 [Chitinophagaceae bacterium]|nr:hypothetical protein [Chitinophagaceae bacterium]
MTQPIRFVLLCATLSQLLFSCGDAATSTKSSTDSTATTDTMSKEPTSAPSGIVTTPENIVIVRYKISDYAKWRALYDTRDSMRSANGIHNYVLGRSVEDTNTIMVALKADDVAKAKAFTKSSSLQSALQKGYVTGTPKYNFTTVVYQDMSPNMSDLRAMTFLTVKDWDAWKTSFEADRQMRTENGLTDRAYGYDADDNHKVVVVVGVNDSTKAAAYWNSDLIKQRRAASGVVGQVERFVYRVVQKY